MILRAAHSSQCVARGYPAMNKTQIHRVKWLARPDAGFTLVEAVIGLGIFGVCFAALLAGIISNAATVRSIRETVRATQIMEEKLDTIRLYSWDQINTSGYISNRFYVPFSPSNALAGSSSPGVTYTGMVTIADAALSETYSTNLKAITIDLYWPSHPSVRHTQMSTFVAKYGLQCYVY